MKKNILPILFSIYAAGGLHSQTFKPDDAQRDEVLDLTVDFSEGHQTIHNFGSSTGMRAGYLAEHWPTDVLDQMARWVFSKEVDAAGNPQGIGLSSFRFEIGAGSAENKKSGISKIWRRSKTFLEPDGSYNWDKSQGLVYWMRQAKKYGVPTLIGYANSPPIAWTRSGYGYKLKRSMDANLKADRYDDYGRYLAIIARHFEEEGLGFDYISPVNEPQWDWTGTPEKAKQEGSPWTNAQIKKVVVETDKAFAELGVATKILISEAARLDYLYKAKPDDFAANASDQINAFWNPTSSDFIGDLGHLAPVVGGHSYWMDTSDSVTVRTRRQLAQRIDTIDPKLDFWQTEYSLLGDGYKEGKKNVSEMDAALFMAKTIHYDLTIADASAWQFWATFNSGPEKGKPQRYTLVDAKTPEDVRPTKNMWVLGNYSRFITPGMQRFSIKRSDDLSSIQQGQKQMASAFYDNPSGRLTVVIINYQDKIKTVRIALNNLASLPNSKNIMPFSEIEFKHYVTTGKEGENLVQAKPTFSGNSFQLKARSITTLTASLRE